MTQHKNTSLSAQLNRAFERAEEKLASIEGEDYDSEMLEKVAIRFSYEAAQHVSKSILTKSKERLKDPMRGFESRLVLNRIIGAWRRFTESAQGSDSVFKNSFAQLLKDLSEPDPNEEMIPNELSMEATSRFSEILTFHKTHVSEAP